MARKRKKIFGKYILVKRKDGKVIIRRYPKDLEMWNKTKDPRYVHPNKLRTWVKLSQVAKQVRGLDYDSAMQEFIKELSGRKYSEGKPPRVIPLMDFVGLKLQAMEKGIPEHVVDSLAIPAEPYGIKRPPEEKEKTMLEALVKLKRPQLAS